MREPVHHLPDELLVDYESGAAPEAVALFVASHLSLCAECRARRGWLDELGGLFLEGGGEVQPPDIDDLLPRLDEVRPEAEPLAGDASGKLPGWVPAPLRPYLPSKEKGGIAWSFRSPLSCFVDLDLAFEGIPVRVATFRAGGHFPRHTHRGEELTLILQGGYDDTAGGTFLPGDVAVVDETVTHALDIHRGEECVLLIVLENRLVPRSLRSRLISTFFPV